MLTLFAVIVAIGFVVIVRRRVNRLDGHLVDIHNLLVDILNRLPEPPNRSDYM